MHLGLSFLVFFVYTLAVGVHFGPMLLLLPLVIALQLLLNTGLALAVSAMNVYYEDVKFIVQHLVSLLFYACPIIYPTSRIVVGADPFSEASRRLFFLYRLNPMASLIFAYQKILLGQAEQLDPRPLDFRVLAITGVECI